MKVIFLDMDGVMVPFQHLGSDGAIKIKNKWKAQPMSKKAIKILNEIIIKTDAEIVISSDWRNYYTLSQMREMFKESGVIKLPIAYTINSYKYKDENLEEGRVHEIREYVERHGIINWVAIDDLNMESLGEHFIHCQRPSSQGIKQTGIKKRY